MNKSLDAVKLSAASGHLQVAFISLLVFFLLALALHSLNTFLNLDRAMEVYDLNHKETARLASVSGIYWPHESEVGKAGAAANVPMSDGLFNALVTSAKNQPEAYGAIFKRTPETERVKRLGRYLTVKADIKAERSGAPS